MALTTTTVLLVILTASLAERHIDKEHVVARPNYGVIFRPTQALRIVTDEWTHVFVMELPESRHVRQDNRDLKRFNCTEVHGLTLASCENIQPLLDTLTTLHMTSIRRVRSIISHIYQILPASYRRRPERGLFDLGGQILNSLFGVATSKQLNAIRTTAQHTLTDNANAFYQWQKHADAMSSFMSVTNERLDNFASIIKDHNEIMQNVNNTTVRLNADIAILRALLTSAITNITNFITVLNELDDIRIAIEDLTHGQLSPVLLPPQILEHALIDIHNDLYTITSSILLGKVAADYYRMHNFIATRQENRLLIAVNFPLSSIPVDLTLYEVQSFPVPVPGQHNDAHVTEIVNLPYNIAFASTDDHYEYLVLPTKPELIDNYFFFAHHQSEPLRKFSTHHTCISSLLRNDRSLITKLCHFHPRPERLTPNLLPLTYSMILVTNISSLTYTCNRKHIAAPGCLQCQMTAPCHCSIHTSFAYIPPRLTGCTKLDENITTYHTVNLAVLQSFFDDEHLSSLLGDNLLDQPLSVELPAFHIFMANDSSRLATDASLSYDLHRADDVNITKADSTVFHSLAETLWHDADAFDNTNTFSNLFTSSNNWTSLIYFLN